MDISTLREALEYFPETGLFFWKTRPVHHFKNEWSMNKWNARYAGQKAGTVYSPTRGIDYMRVKIVVGNKPVFAHQLAWWFVHGVIPHGLFVDHIDGDATNNAISNLRLVTHSENHRNRRIQSNNSSGVPGVQMRRGKWCARIKINGKEKYLGSFASKEQAIDARKKFAIHHGFTERHHTDRRPRADDAGAVVQENIP
jgi:hypothetical protein